MNAPKLRFKSGYGRDHPEWIARPLKEVCQKIKDGTHFSPKSKFGPRKYITSKNIRNGGLDLSSCSYISEDEHREIYKRCPVELGDILLTKDGAGTGNCCTNTLAEEFSLLSSVAVLSGEVGILSNEFLLQLLQSRAGQNTISNVIAGQAITRITLDKINKFTFMFPVYEEQRKISSFLMVVDQKISLLTRQHELLVQYRKGVMQKIFNQEIRFKDRGGENFPEWEYFSGDEIFKSVNNRNHNSELPILSATQDRGMYPRSENGIDIISSEKSVSSYKVINKGDYVISLRSFQGGIEYSEYDGISSPAYTVLKPTKEISDNFFRAYFKKDSFISQLNGTVVGIRDGKQISFSAFSTLELPYPCIKEQELIANFLSLIDKKIALCNAELMATKQYKQGLLQQMFI